MSKHRFPRGTPFWERVRPTASGCWEWQGAKDNYGYGSLTVEGERKRAHRYAYELSYGPVPEGLVVRHKCDNPSCCNPEHLELGTQRDNVHDIYKRGRQNYGERTGECNNSARLTWEQVRRIRELYDTGEYSQMELAELFGVHQTQISNIVLHKKWKEAA